MVMSLRTPTSMGPGRYPVKADSAFKYNHSSAEISQWTLSTELRKKAPGAEQWMAEYGARVSAFPQGVLPAADGAHRSADPEE